MRQTTRYEPTGALTVTSSGVGGPASGAPVLTGEVPLNEHGVVEPPQPPGIGNAAPMLRSVWVVPLGFRVVSSTSALTRPMVFCAWLADMPAGRSVAVWNPAT